MASLIDKTFFIRDLSIPNLGITSSAVDSSTQDRLTSFINKYEPECLKGILGSALYKALQSENSQRITDLKNGANFNSCYWDGLVHDTDQSLIANYVYYKWMYIGAVKQTSKGAKKPSTDGGIIVNPSDALVDAWNDFSRQCDILYDFLIYNASVYQEFTADVYRSANDFSYPINVFGI